MSVERSPPSGPRRERDAQPWPATVEPVGRRHDLRSHIGREHLEARIDDERGRDVRGTGADVQDPEHPPWIGGGTQVGDGPAGDVDAPEPAVDPAQIAEVAREEIGVERSVEQLGRVGQTIHAVPIPLVCR